MTAEEQQEFALQIATDLFIHGEAYIRVRAGSGVMRALMSGDFIQERVDPLAVTLRK